MALQVVEAGEEAIQQEEAEVGAMGWLQEEEVAVVEVATHLQETLQVKASWRQHPI
jgi:hypothetical protein